MSFFANWFVKITAWLPQLFVFRIKVYYEDKKVQSKRVRGKAIIASNHTSLMDFAVMMLVFWRRTLRCVVAELMYAKNFMLTFLLKTLGTIKVNRDIHDFSFLGKCQKILDKGGVIEIYPEARLPGPKDKELLEFKPSTVYLALESGAPIIPVYTNGENFSRKRCRVIIGKPIYVWELYDDSLDKKENIENINAYLRGKIIELGKELERRVQAEKSK